MILMTFLSLQSFAQVTVAPAEFDFTKPIELTPSVVPDPYDGGFASVMGWVFTSSDISLIVSRDTDRGGAYICTSYNSTTEEFSYYFATHHANFTISAPSGFYLTKVRLTGYINLTAAEGELNHVQNDIYEWTPVNSTTSSVLFKHLQTQMPMIEKITVEYTAPSDVLQPYNETLIDSEGNSYAYSLDKELHSFRSLNLAFGGSLNVINSNGVTMVQTDKDNAVVPVTVTASGGTATIKVNDDITEDGDFSISIAARTFQSGNYQNAALPAYTFKVKKNRAKFNMESVTPENNSTDTELAFPITLMFPNTELSNVGMVDEETELNLNLQVEGENSVTTIAKVKLAKGAEGAVLLNPTGSITTFSTKGVYTLVIPEGMVFNQLYSDPDLQLFNPEIVLTYTVAAPPDPLAALKQEVASLKEKIGRVGYPVAGSEADIALNKALDDIKEGTTLTEDEQKVSLETAISTFYVEKNVMLPKQKTGNSDGWYHIVGVNAHNNKLYLQFVDDGTKITLTNIKNKAAAFQAVVVDNAAKTIVFKSKDGKYLHLPHVQQNYDVDGMTLTDGKDGKPEAINILKLEKFLLEGKQKEMAGLFTLYGSLGTKGGSAEKSAYALYQFNTMTVSTDPDFTEKNLTFEEEKSNAFIFEETTEPQSEINALTPEVDRETVVLEKAGDEMTLTIMANGELESVELAKNAEPYFVQMGEKVVFTGTILTKVENIVGKFYINTAGLKAGSFGLVMPANTFVFTAVDKSKTVKQIQLTKDFKIRKGSDSEPIAPTPTVDLNTNTMTLTIKNVSKATINNAITPYFTKNGERVTFTGTILTKKTDVSFNVNTKGLTVGAYSLVLPKGSFILTVDDKVQELADMIVNFNISSGGEDSHDSHSFVTDFTDYSTYPSISGDKPINDSDLNDFWVYCYKDANNPTKQNFFVDVTKKVRLANYWNINETYREGHFELDLNFRSDVWAYKIVWEPKIKQGEIYRNEALGVGIAIPEGTVGDSNFGVWLDDHDKVEESSCHVNKFVATYFLVDNEKAASREQETVFANYKSEQKVVATNKAKKGDSEECTKLISDAKAAIDALTYDTTKSLDENKARVDAIISKLDTDLAAQRAQDAIKAKFASYKKDQQALATNRAQKGDSKECEALITAAKAAIEALTFDSNKSLDENKARVDAIISKLDTDLAAQRALDASKEALSQAITDATNYLKSIKDEHAAVANLLSIAIDGAKAKLKDAASSKAELDAAKQTLDAALDAAKQAIATGIYEIEASGNEDNVTYYSLEGRKLDGKPTKKGVYIVNGRKVVVK